MGVGNLKLQKPRGPRGWGIYNFENPGDPGGGGLRLSWGFPNSRYNVLNSQSKHKIYKSIYFTHQSLYAKIRFNDYKEACLKGFQCKL